MNTFAAQSLEIRCRDEILLLHPQRVMFWPASSTLFAADIHVGKEHVFARSGIAIPKGISEDVLQRLFTLCDAANASTLIILGDFVHSTPLPGEGWLSTLTQLLDQRPRLTVRVIAGNHDTRSARCMIDTRIQWQVDAELQGPFLLQHMPTDDERAYVLSGHLHPAWRLSAGGRCGVRAPVFWFRPKHAVLPAFGSFTGGMLISPDRSLDELYMIGDECVIPVPVTTSRRIRSRMHKN